MPRTVCYYHAVWSTKHRQLLITPQIKTVIEDVIRRKSHALKCKIHAIYAMPDHMHVAVSIRVSMAVSEWVRQVKSLSSKTIRDAFDMDDTFRWQNSYSIHTFGERRLGKVCEYIENQEQRHRDSAIYAYLETVPDDSDT